MHGLVADSVDKWDDVVRHYADVFIRGEGFADVDASAELLEYSPEDDDGVLVPPPLPTHTESAEVLMEPPNPGAVLQGCRPRFVCVFDIHQEYEVVRAWQNKCLRLRRELAVGTLFGESAYCREDDGLSLTPDSIDRALQDANADDQSALAKIEVLDRLDNPLLLRVDALRRDGSTSTSGATSTGTLTHGQSKYPDSEVGRIKYPLAVGRFCDREKMHLALTNTCLRQRRVEGITT